ncbi:hypothetical protein ACIRON_02865 [Nocardioides sp. NPDC101246]|uniref:hypothetical protein n=1 Tax=Nocardioides sp. NPDC101246 TaxID=3364336 RepID=UPI003816DC7A
MTTTTSRAARDKALAILREQGASEEQAETTVRRLSDAGIHLVEVEVTEPYTGERADESTKERALAKMRAELKGTSE